MKDRKVHANNVDIHVVDFGGEGTPIVCVHGLTANSRCFDSIAASLTDHYHVFGIDLRGRGDSEKPPYGYDIYTHAKDVHGVLRALSIPSCIFIGHSLGAFIGLAFSTLFPNSVKQLILLDGGCPLSETIFEKIRPSIDRLDVTYPSFEAYIQAMRKNPFFHPWTIGHEQYFYADCIHFPDGTVRSKVSKEAVKEEVEALKNVDITKFYDKIKTHTLLLRAGDCFMDDNAQMVTDEHVKQLQRKIVGSSYELVEEANHYSILFSKADETAQFIHRFLGTAHN